VSLKTLTFTMELSGLPASSKELGVRFTREKVEQIKGGTTEMVLFSPATKLLSEEDAVGPEPTFYRIMCGIDFKDGRGTAAQGTGQLLITPQRLIGMLADTGQAGGRQLGFSAGSVIFCFSCLRGDVGDPAVDRKRLKPSDFTFSSQPGLPVAFRFTVFAAFAAIANNKMSFWHDDKMEKALGEDQ
jgi:hypothetical protein